jgi:hypothetical protein
MIGSPAVRGFRINCLHKIQTKHPNIKEIKLHRRS